MSETTLTQSPRQYSARPIGASLQLLEALELMVATFCDTEGSHGALEAEAIDKARAAIQQATRED